MSITVNIYYTGEKGSARKFAEEMTSSGTVEAIDIHHGTPMMDTIFKLREKYNLHMKVERYISNDEIPEKDKKFIRE